MASEDLQGKQPEEIPFPASCGSGVTPLRDCFLIKGYTICPCRCAFLSPIPPPTKSKKANFGASSPPALGTPVSPASGSHVFLQPHSSPCLALVLWQLILQHLPAQSVRKPPCQVRVSPTGPCSSHRWYRKESYKAQNSLELKVPSRSSPPFYAKQRTLSPEEKMDIKVDYTQLPAHSASGQSPKFLAPAV